MFTDETHLFTLQALQPLNQTDSEPYQYGGSKDAPKKAVGMRTMQHLDRTSGIRTEVPFISAESVVHKLREALWLTILHRYGFRLTDFRSPAGAVLTYLMMNGGDTNIGQMMDGVKDFDRIADMPSRFPLLGAFGFTLGGTFFPSWTAWSFVLPFVEGLPIWHRYRDSSDPLTVPSVAKLSDCLAKAADNASNRSITYYRHPEAMGPYYRQKPKKERQKADDPATQIIAGFQPVPHTFEYIPSGTPLAFTLQFDSAADDLVRSTVRFAFDHWVNAQNQVTLGSHVNRGFGLVEFNHYPPSDSFPTATPFEKWLAAHDAAMRRLLTDFANARTVLPKDVMEHPEPLFDLINRLFAL